MMFSYFYRSFGFLLISIVTSILSICGYNNNNCIDQMDLLIGGQWPSSSIIQSFFNYLEEDVSSLMLGITCSFISIFALYFSIINFKKLIKRK